MLIMPAIDISEGHCVRLRQGQFNDVTVYNDDPFAQLEAFAQAGAQWVHVVDLDGAKLGKPQQHALLGELARSVGLNVQVGGGVRTREHIEKLIGAGVERVVVGSATVRRPDEVRAWLNEVGGERICCAFDFRRTADQTLEVAVDGWASDAGVTLTDALGLYEDANLTHALVTDISRDGVLGGPNVEAISNLVKQRPDLRIQASGGVASLDDLSRLRAAGAAAAIVGRALYDRCFTLEDALAG